MLYMGPVSNTRRAPIGTTHRSMAAIACAWFRKNVLSPSKIRATAGIALGSANGFGEQDAQRFGHVTAVDADSGNVLWKYDADTPMVASVTPTAGGVLLTGDTKGNFLAFNAATGQVLLKKNLGDPIGGGIVTYMLGGSQYVAVAGGMKNPIVQTESGPAWVAIFALPDHTD